MGMRYRKSIGLGKGVRLNVGKGSLGISAGVKGAHVSVNSKRGVTTSVGAPGTGVSYAKTTGWGSSGADGGPGGPPKKKRHSLAIIGLVVLLCICVVYVLAHMEEVPSTTDRSAPPPTVSTSANTGTDSDTSAPGATTTDVNITTGSQAAPIDVIADGVETYLEGLGYPVSSTRKVADHSRVECVVTVPGLSDSDGIAKPANWSDVQTDLVSLAAGAQSAVTDQGDYTVLVYVQSANGDNLLAADSSKVIYDKFQAAADTAAAKDQAAEKTVYVSATGSKYHSKPDCGNMSSATEITLSEAQSRGLTACSRCW